MASPPPSPAQSNDQSDGTEASRLLWQCIHYTTALVALLTAYLSLEAIHRDSINFGLCTDTRPDVALAATAGVMVDIGSALTDVRAQLLGTESHSDWIKENSYQCLIDAGAGLAVVTALVKEGPGHHEVVTLRFACDEMTELCYGHAGKGIVGWRKCWEEIIVGGTAED